MKKETIKRILRYVRPYNGLVLLSLLCAAISAGAQLLIPIFTGDVLDLEDPLPEDMKSLLR